MTPTTLTAALESHALQLAERAAVIYHDRKTSYRELNDRANKVASYLEAIGARKGDIVAVALQRTPELIESFLGIAKAQCVAAPVDYDMPPERIHDLLASVSAICVVVESSFLPHFEQNLPSTVKQLVVVGGKTGRHQHWSAIMDAPTAANPAAKPAFSDLVYLNYTSGSTGIPKGAVTTHANVFHNTNAAVDALGLTGDDVHLCLFASFAHPHELFARALYLGGTTVLLDTIYPRSIARAVSDNGVTCMMAIAPVYECLLEAQSHGSIDLSSLRVPESGGMFTRQDLIERFAREVGVPILPVWGSTETTGIAVATRPGNPRVPGSVGHVCASYTLKILDETGGELAPGEIGEMAFSGPAVVAGYYRDHVNTEKAFQRGYYRTGDLGRMDREGNVFFVERKAGMMKVAGRKVFPLEIEQVLLEHPHIAQAAVIKVEDKLRGEIPKAIVVSRNGCQLTKSDVANFCKERLPNYKCPRVVEFRQDLPKIGSGKVNKKALQRESDECIEG